MRKKIYILFILAWLVPILAMAQSSPTARVISATSGAATVDHGGTNITFYYNMGGPVLYNASQNAFPAPDPDEDGQVRMFLGMPYIIPYFPKLFENNFFVSKGFFGGYVQLSWNIIGSGDNVTSFRIFRREYGAAGDSTFIASVASNTFTYRDDFADKGVLYEYWVYAMGVGGFPTPFVNYVTGVGIAMPTANATGRITYAGGNAVEGVRVVAETDGSLGGKSLYLDDAQSAHLTIPHDSKMELREGFTWQGYYRAASNTTGVLFSKGNDYEISYDPSGAGSLSFKVANATATMPFKAPIDSFFHVSASYMPGGELRLFVNITDEKRDSVKVAAGTQPAVNTDPIYVGRNNGGSYFKGYVDELRLWKKQLTQAEIRNNYNRYISAQADKLEGYWRITEGISPFFFDLARTGNNFHQHHGTASSGQWSNTIPLASQLGFVGFTNANGNYSIQGFPYETGGSLYTFTPILGVHKFDPPQQQRFVSDGQTVLNDINFTDISSFRVSGTVEYRNTNFPVQGVSILIDGQPAIGPGGVLVTTNNDGFFEVDVPIGLHSLQVSMNGHGYERRGYFVPLGQENASIPQYNYQQPLSGLRFVDTTLVKITGRIVGGVREKAKLLGFGLSNNNIGNAVLTLKADKEKDLVKNLPDSTSIHTERNFFSTSVKFQTFNVEISADVESGEFIAFLPPENYTTTGIIAGPEGASRYTFDESYRVPWNLKTTTKQTEIKYDTAATINTVPVPDPRFVNPWQPSKYQHTYSFTRGDTVFFVGVDTFRFDVRKDFILRVTPTVNITNEEGGNLHGETAYKYIDDANPDGIEVPLITGNSYNYDFPVFLQGKKYKMKAEVFEEYKNGHQPDSETDRVPVSDGFLETTNNFGTVTAKEVIPFDAQGRATYTFTGGAPQVNMNAGTFTRPLSITAITGENQNIRTDWGQNPFQAIIFGGVLQGTGFVTTGPTEIVTILRDPPGSNSITTLEKGSTITNTKSWAKGVGLNDEINQTFKLGTKVTTFVGLGAGVINEVETTADLSIGLSAKIETNQSGDQVHTVTNTQTWSTSDDNDFVGSVGDVFVGYSTNISYGKAISLQLLPESSVECQGGDCGTKVSNNFKLGKTLGLALNPEYGTGFIYTQKFIEDELLPNLETIRNSYLTYAASHTSVSATTKVLYVTEVNLASDPAKFGSSNSDRTIWGDQAKGVIGNGPSYYIKLPPGKNPDEVVDSVEYFNKQIDDWKYWLAENEKQKVQSELIKNISLDGGSLFTSSESVERSTTTTREFKVSIAGSLGSELGFEALGIGFNTTIKREISSTDESSTSNQVSTTTTYSYSLRDQESSFTEGGGVLDYHSIDIKKPKDGFGPVFYLRAGATSCPHEDGQLTKYFQPGQHSLQQATLQTEKFELQILNPSVANVPENRAAEIQIRLNNNSESENDLWMVLALDESTNPDGLVLSVDGFPLTGNGRNFFVRYGQTITKTIKVFKGSETVFDYEDVKIQIQSSCGQGTLSEAAFSVYYQPGCSDIRLTAPINKWTVNTVTGSSMSINFDQYNLQNANFKYAAFQYKSASSSQWTTQTLFYNPNQYTQEQFEALQEPKEWLNVSGTTVYQWNMNDLADRNYDVRVVSYCEIAPGNFVTTPSDVHSGIKDMKRPLLFGSPQPADGILSPGDEISIQFDEDLEAGLIGLNNFSMRGVLNNYPIAHNSSLGFDGLNDYVSIGSGLNLSRRSFTIEVWLRRNPDGFGQEQVFFSRGNSTTDRLEIGFTADSKLFVDMPGRPRVTSNASFNTTMGDPGNPAFVPDNGWNHYTIAYDHQNRKVYGYRSGEYVIEQDNINHTIPDDGIINIGRAILTQDRHFRGNLHELRIWEDFRQIGQVSSQMNVALNGLEIGLVGLWQMDEAFGKVALDKARFRHGQVFAQWVVEPKGRAYQFNGSDSYVEISTASSIVVSKEQDFTIEFWFKAPAQNNTVMFSSGKGDGSASDLLNTGSWSIGFNQNGRLYVANSGKYITLSGAAQNFADNNWHHFALTSNRRGNTQVFVDGVLQGSLASSNFGALMGQYMWIGARGFKVNSTDFSRDHFFNGTIDELRIWNLQRKQTQIELDRNAQVERNSMGLIGYFPFEKFVTSQGIQQMTPTLEDMWIAPNNVPNSGTAVAFGSGDYTDQTANIKQARPVSNIDFTYAINKDKIILTPLQSVAAAIEKTIIEITVERVEDKNGNRMANPITWSAFIDQNQLKWGTARIEAEKKLYDPYTFTVDVVNLSGTHQQYSISNLPPWLTASPQSGSLAPLTSQKVTFTVNQGINTGTYRQDLFLTGDFGFDEKLILDLRVFRPLPEDWKVNPNEFQFSMNVIGRVRIQGKISSDPNDMVGAFVNDECRGLVNLEYVPQYDYYLAFLTIYSRTTDPEEIKLKIWDDSEGQVFTEVTPEYNFQANQSYGKPSAPIMIEVLNVIENDITVPKGWKWISFGLTTNKLSDVNHILKDVAASNGDQVQGIQHFDSYFASEGKWLGTISQYGGFKNNQMYKMKAANASSIRYFGEIPDPSLTPVNIVKGWNWIGFISQRNMGVNEALQSLVATDGDIIKSQYQLAIYDANFGWIGNLKNLIPGEGYMIFAENATTFHFPQVGSLGGRLAEDVDFSYLNLGDFVLNPHQFERQMSIVAEVRGLKDLPQDTRLIAKAGDRIVGIGTMETNPANGKALFFITVFGNSNGAELQFAIYSPDGAVIGRANESMPFTSDRVVGGVHQPYVFNINELDRPLEGKEDVKLYPNPFVRDVNLVFALDEKAYVEVDVYNMVGQKVRQLVQGELSAGQHNINWDSEGLPAGMYHLKLAIEGDIRLFKIVKL